MRGQITLAGVALFAIFAGLLMASPAVAQEDTTTTNQVEVRLIQELTFDSEIQILRLKDGLPRLVVTEKTINWLDQEGGVEGAITIPANHWRTTSPLEAEHHRVMERYRVFASSNGEWAAIVRYDTREMCPPESGLVMLHTSSGSQAGPFRVAPLAIVTICDDGSRFALHGVQAFPTDAAIGAGFVLYDSLGNELARFPGQDASGFGKGVAAAFSDDGTTIAFQPVASSPQSVYVLSRGGDLLWKRSLEGSSGLHHPYFGISSHGERVFAVAQDIETVPMCSYFSVATQDDGGDVVCGVEGIVLRLYPSCDYSRCLLASVDAIRCMSAETADEQWVWPAPPGWKAGGVQWTQEGLYVVAEAWELATKRKARFVIEHGITVWSREGDSREELSVVGTADSAEECLDRFVITCGPRVSLMGIARHQ